MKGLKFIVTGIFFGIILTKAEIISWFRIQEMFHFDSFHMYGIIGSAITLGIIITRIIKLTQMKDMAGSRIKIAPKNRNYKAAIIGGTIFGLGWAMTGACPGPLYILIGNGYIVMILAVASAILGTFVYGRLKDKLPH